MVIRPYGYSLWERIQSEIDARIKRSGAENVYLPLFIPEAYFKREPSTSRGSARNWLWSPTRGARSSPSHSSYALPVRTLFGELMAKWVQSHRDLPLLLNQWVNVVRWEMRPRLFLRTSEFLWQEGHTAHASYEDAAAYRAGSTWTSTETSCDRCSRCRFWWASRRLVNASPEPSTR